LVRQRSERYERDLGPQQGDSFDLAGQTGMPTERGPFESHRVLLGEQAAVGECVLEIQSAQLTRGALGKRKVPVPDSPLEIRVDRPSRHEHMFPQAMTRRTMQRCATAGTMGLFSRIAQSRTSHAQSQGKQRSRAAETGQKLHKLLLGTTEIPFRKRIE